MATNFWKPGTSEGTFVKPSLKFKLPKITLGSSAGRIIPALGGIILAFCIAFYFFIFMPLHGVSSQVKSLKSSVDLISEGFTNRDLLQMRQGFDATEQSLKDLRDYRDAKFGWVAKFGPTKGYYVDSEAAIVTGEHLISAGREMATLSEPFADAIGLRVSEDQEPSQLSLIDAVSSWVSIMPEIAENIDGVIYELSLAGDSLSKIDPNRYPEKIRGNEVRGNLIRAQKALSSMNEAAPDIKKALVVIPTLLGVDGHELRYMIIMQNDKEIRPTGGFWTNYATFKVVNAMLNSDFSSNDMYSIDLLLEQIDAYYDFPDAPPAYAQYLKVNHLYARDTNYSPDFPSSVDNFMKFYDMAMPLNPSEIKPVDGVIAIDTVVLEELMEITGPVTVGGFTYNSENVVLELEKLASLALKEQVGRKDILGSLMQAMLINVFESDGNLWPALIEKGVDLAVRKHIQAFVYDPAAQALIENYKLGGRISPSKEGTDYAFVVSTNLGGDKTNWFVKKQVTHTLEKSGDRWIRTVKLAYTYDQPNSDYSPFVKRYQDWVRLYVPEGSELIESTGFENSIGGGTEMDKTYFDGFFGMGPGETKELSFKYYLPEGVVNTAGDYALNIQKQAGIESETHVVQIPGYSETLELTKDVVFEHSL
jgi:hypothetical protein